MKVGSLLGPDIAGASTTGRGRPKAEVAEVDFDAAMLPFKSSRSQPQDRDRDGLEQLHERIAANKQTVSAALATLERLVYTDEGQDMLAAIKRERVAYVDSFTKVDKLLQDGERNAAAQLLTSETLPASRPCRGM